jgi:hypothetical protein
VTVLVVFEAIVMVLLALLVFALLRAHAEVLRRLHELGAGLESGGGLTTPVAMGETPLAPIAAGAVGNQAPDVIGSTPLGDAVSVGFGGRSQPTLLAFLSTGCTTCGAMWEELGHSGSLRLPDPKTRLVLVTRGQELESPGVVAALAPRDLLTVMSSEAWVDYHVRGTPYFVLVDGPSGRITGEGSALSWEQVGSLLARAAADTAASTGHGFRGRERSVDEVLGASGIGPGHPSLYPQATGNDAAT